MTRLRQNREFSFVMFCLEVLPKHVRTHICKIPCSRLRPLYILLDDSCLFYLDIPVMKTFCKITEDHLLVFLNYSRDLSCGEY